MYLICNTLCRLISVLSSYIAVRYWSSKMVPYWSCLLWYSSCCHIPMAAELLESSIEGVLSLCIPRSFCPISGAPFEMHRFFYLQFIYWDLSSVIGNIISPVIKHRCSKLWTLYKSSHNIQEKGENLVKGKSLS